jgi:SpoU rRNA methylase family enzyme
MDAGVEKAKGRQRTTLGDALTGVTTLFKTSYTLGDITNVLGEVGDAIEASTKTIGAITGAKGALAKINVLKQATEILQGEIATATAQASTRFAASSVQYALKRKKAQEKFEAKHLLTLKLRKVGFVEFEPSSAQNEYFLKTRPILSIHQFFTCHLSMWQL